jgi:hypothetical protein
MTVTQPCPPLLGSIQENRAQPNSILANIREIIETTLNPATVSTILPLADALYLAYSYSNEPSMTRDQWKNHNGWGQYFTSLEANDVPGEGASK